MNNLVLINDDVVINVDCVVAVTAKDMTDDNSDVHNVNIELSNGTNIVISNMTVKDFYDRYVNSQVTAIDKEATYKFKFNWVVFKKLIALGFYIESHDRYAESHEPYDRYENIIDLKSVEELEKDFDLFYWAVIKEMNDHTKYYSTKEVDEILYNKDL